VLEKALGLRFCPYDCYLAVPRLDVEEAGGGVSVWRRVVTSFRDLTLRPPVLVGELGGRAVAAGRPLELRLQEAARAGLSPCRGAPRQWPGGSGS